MHILPAGGARAKTSAKLWGLPALRLWVKAREGPGLGPLRELPPLSRPQEAPKSCPLPFGKGLARGVVSGGGEHSLS